MAAIDTAIAAHPAVTTLAEMNRFLLAVADPTGMTATTQASNYIAIFKSLALNGPISLGVINVVMEGTNNPVWPPAARAIIQDGLRDYANRLPAVHVAATMPGPRNATQKFHNVDNFMTKTVLGDIAASQNVVVRFRVMSGWLGALGVRRGDEKTMQRSVQILMTGLQGYTPHQMLNTYRDFKQFAKNHFRRIPAPLEDIPIYPDMPDELRISHPATYNAAFRGEPPICADLSGSEHFPCRKSAASVRLTPSMLLPDGSRGPDVAAQFMQLMNNMCQNYGGPMSAMSRPLAANAFCAGGGGALALEDRMPPEANVALTTRAIANAPVHVAPAPEPVGNFSANSGAGVGGGVASGAGGGQPGTASEGGGQPGTASEGGGQPGTASEAGSVGGAASVAAAVDDTNAAADALAMGRRLRDALFAKADDAADAAKKRKAEEDAAHGVPAKGTKKAGRPPMSKLKQPAAHKMLKRPAAHA